jgi:hypothetical protein
MMSNNTTIELDYLRQLRLSKHLVVVVSIFVLLNTQEDTRLAVTIPVLNPFSRAETDGELSGLAASRIITTVLLHAEHKFIVLVPLIIKKGEKEKNERERTKKKRRKRERHQQ